LEMLERQQRNLEQWPERTLLKLNIDAGGVLSRKVIDRLLAEENAARPQRPVIPVAHAREAS
ncbi:hypothetical protein M3616_23435, partial [Bacillus velezensis]|nr:hypothetical protein [Bacillus velezensis]